MKFRRKSADPVESQQTGETDVEAPAEDTSAAAGPYDVADAPDDGIPRVDLGSLMIPAVEGLELRLQLDEATQEVRAAILTAPEGALELRAFAAPRNGDLWSEVRPRISADYAQRGGTAGEREGRWGPELHCQLTVQMQDGRTGTQPSRIIGVNGPRWLLRATLLGRAAIDASQSAGWEQVIERVQVRRGDAAMPVGAELALRVPTDGVRRTDG